MRAKKAKRLRRLAVELGRDSGKRKWLDYRYLGPFKKIVKVQISTTEEREIEIHNYTRVNAGIRGIYLNFKKGVRMRAGYVQKAAKHVPGRAETKWTKKGGMTDGSRACQKVA